MPDAKTRLLIVDDEPATRVLLAQIFTGMGHQVDCAADGFAALQQIRQAVPDVILSDLNMPGMSGFEFLSVVRRRLPGIYVIATSGAYSGNAIPEGVAADAFYEKATNLRELFDMVQAAAMAQAVPVREDAARTPIWLCPQREPQADTEIVIPCPECLRTFPQRHASRAGVVQRVDCLYCRSAILYAVVEVLAAVSEHAYHAELDAVMTRRGPAPTQQSYRSRSA